VPTVTDCSSPNAILKNLQYSWSPNDIEPGEEISISFSGDLTQSASQLNLDLVASFDSIPIINKQMNVCPLLKNGQKCPVPVGKLSHDIKFTIPNLPISGEIGAKATLTDQTGAQIVCLNLALNI
jgi:hypothetical protein